LERRLLRTIKEVLRATKTIQLLKEHCFLSAERTNQDVGNLTAAGLSDFTALKAF
jgi:hypothetical protein